MACDAYGVDVEAIGPEDPFVAELTLTGPPTGSAQGRLPENGDTRRAESSGTS